MNWLIPFDLWQFAFCSKGTRTRKFIDDDESGTLNGGDTDIQEYAWDVKNRLVRVTDRDTFGGDETQIVDLIYDMYGRRIGMEVDVDGDGDVLNDGDYRERFAWDFIEYGQIGKGNVVLDFIDSDLDGTAEDHELSARQLWGQRVDELFAQEEVSSIASEGETYWTLTDNLGTVRDLVTYATSTTTLEEHYTFEAFGTMTRAEDGFGVELTAQPTTRYTFTAQEYISVLDVYYYDTRIYDAPTAQFMSPDPVEDDAENTYRYVGNSPTLYTDPSGTRVLVPKSLKDEYYKWRGEMLSSGNDLVWAFPAEAEGAYMEGSFSLEFGVTKPAKLVLREPEVLRGDLWLSYVGKSWFPRERVIV